MKGCRSTSTLLRTRRGEVRFFSIVGFRSKRHRDEVNRRMFCDPRMLRLQKAEPLFDMKRMVVGELETFVGRAAR
jgi:uncharacterized protein YbaA (DUF1428 family)